MTRSNSAQLSSAHLSEEALNDVLIGLGSPESEAHLAVCPACRSRVEEFQSAMQAFNATSIAWSEAQSAQPLPLAVRTRSNAMPTYATPLRWALAATVLVAVGLPVWNANHRPAHDIAVVSPEDTDAQIAADNDLLRSVDLALSSSDEPSVSKYHLLEGPPPRAAQMELGKP